MNKTVKMGLNRHTAMVIPEVLKNNLFSLGEDAWFYTDNNDLLTMSITYAVEGNGIVFNVWMIDESMQILLDKIVDEIKG